ncbi:MAG TPA: ABC transporter substrate-binding protein, partial [Streptosporangiaceae bacterium]|nr:ABC transporter substrate-binding protein [Streptosporangiaceae bacterium]
MKGRLVLAAAAVGSLAVAGCSSSTNSSTSSSSSSAAAGGGSSASTKACVASVGFEGPITGPVAPLGTEQLHFAELAVATDNAANNTKITLVQGDTQLNPAMAVTVTQQFTSNSAILATVGPAGSQEVEAIGGLMDRAGMAFISGSATAV